MNHDAIKKRFAAEIRSHTAFCQEVWKECLNIPSGTVLTYKELAQKIGRPRAARAVGTALARNPFAPYVPCHRVIRSDGGMGGYSAPGGITRKKRMLDREKRSRSGR